MQAVHIPLPIRQHRRWLSGLPAPDLTGPWHERLVRSPWTYVFVFATALYVGCLRGMYWNLFAKPRSAATGERPSGHTIAMYYGGYVGFGAAIGVLIVVGLLVLRHLRGRLRLGLLTLDLVLLAAAAGWAFLTFVAAVRIPGVAFMTRIHGFGPSGVYQLVLGWSALTMLAACGLWLVLRGTWEGRRRWPRYLAAALVVGVYVGLFAALQYAMTSWLAINVEGVAPDDLWNRIVLHYAQYAFYTLAFWVVLFLAVDRWRPQRLLVWYLALGWGACVSTYLSMFLNTWVQSMMSISTTGPGVDHGSAVYSAPFVEEACKATILFILAALLRYRLTSRSSLFTLAGLSAAGFAFTENILYYVRAHLSALSQVTQGDAYHYTLELVKLRGVYTAFGHELFTASTAIGLIAAVSTRSKSVRILAPVAGFCGAALGHMSFNGSSILMPSRSEGFLYTVYGCTCAIVILVFIGVSMLNTFRDGSRIRARLTDYVRMGWLRPSDPRDYGRQWSRAILLWNGFFSALRRLRPSRFFHTVSMIRAMTELAFLRDAMTRGIVDDAGLEREKEVVAKIRRLRDSAVARRYGSPSGGATAPVGANPLPVPPMMFPAYPPVGPGFVPAALGPGATAPGYAHPAGAFAPPAPASGGYPGQDRWQGNRF